MCHQVLKGKGHQGHTDIKINKKYKLQKHALRGTQQAWKQQSLEYAQAKSANKRCIKYKKEQGN